MLIESFETPIGRSSDNQRERQEYSGKMKMQTLKSQIITDQDGEIMDILAGVRGPASEMEI